MINYYGSLETLRNESNVTATAYGRHPIETLHQFLPAIRTHIMFLFASESIDGKASATWVNVAGNLV